MIRFRSILLALMLLIPAAGAIAIAPGGTLDGTGGLNERTPGVSERSPALAPSSIEVGDRATENVELPAEVENYRPQIVKKSTSTNDLDEGTSAASVRPEAQHKSVQQMDRAEKKAFRARVKNNKKDLKNALVKARKDKKENRSADDTELLLLVILAILLPPLAVYLYDGSITINFWISLILTLIFWLPGIIFALVYILGGF